MRADQTSNTVSVIDPRQTAHQTLWQKLPEGTQYPADDILGSVDRIWYSQCFPSTIGVEHHIAREKGKQPFHVTGSYSIEKALQQVILFLRGRFEAWPHRAHMLARSPQNLPAITSL
jgi:hypothetical protein